MAKSKVISVWLPVDLVSDVDGSAAGFGVSRNRFIRTMLERAVAEGRGDAFGHDGLDPVVVEEPSHRSAP